MTSTSPTRPTVHTVRHTVEVDARPDAVYAVVADVERWPVVLGPTVHVERLDGGGERAGGGTEEHLALWATANGEVRNWTSLRRLDPAARTITFRQQQPAPPVAAMGGRWTLEPLAAERCRIVLDHDYAAVDDDAEAVEWIGRATDRNSTAELAAIKQVAEDAAASAELTLSFTDTVAMGGSAADVYAFLREADRWPARLPHVARLDLTEDVSGVQVMEMDTRAPNGDVHTTRSVRVCFDPDRIVYKQIALPALLAVHTGEWRVAPDGDGGVSVSSQHTVRIEPDAIEPVLGGGATVDDAKAFVRNALSTNSTTTLAHAKAFAERAAADG